MTATNLPSPPALDAAELFCDVRISDQGPSRTVRFPRATPIGGGAISRSEDGAKCAVTGRESLRILWMSEPSDSHPIHPNCTVGPGGYRVETSRNLWEGSGLKIDSVSTDVSWGRKQYASKILTSARNGELIMWDLNKAGPVKYERRTKDHIRSINKIALSEVVENYCITGSSDGDMRVWDLRIMNKSIMRMRHPNPVRALAFSPSHWSPLQAVVGLDNGTIVRWDLRQGQRGSLERMAVAHSASITALDWRNVQNMHESDNGLGWIVSGGLDRCVKIWDLSQPDSHTRLSSKPTYTLHPSFPVRRVMWRPSYECEIAIVSNTEFATKSGHDLSQGVLMSNAGGSGTITRVGSAFNLDALPSLGLSTLGSRQPEVGRPSTADTPTSTTAGAGDAIEVWDVRRGWVAKWTAPVSAVDVGVTDVTFGNDVHCIWAQHTSGTFSQIDLRDATRPLDAIPRVAASWNVEGSMSFVVDQPLNWEIPYDDLHPEFAVNDQGAQIIVKALGDESHQPETQIFGTLDEKHLVDVVDRNVVEFMARNYLIEGGDKVLISQHNAEIAYATGQDHLAQAWLLLSTSLADSPLSCPQGGHQFCLPMPSAKPVEATPIDLDSPEKHAPSARLHSASPVMGSETPRRSFPRTATATPRGLTPTSSAASSPKYLSTTLPTATPFRPHSQSIFARRPSIDTRAPSLLHRRPSLAYSSSHFQPSPLPPRVPVSKHVGEGALDDSDSESGEGTPEGFDSMAPKTFGLGLIRPPGPSPLRDTNPHDASDDELGERDDEDDEDDDSNSPCSSSESSGTELEGGNRKPKFEIGHFEGSSKRRRGSKSKRNSRRTSYASSSRITSRNRSSTIASLTAPRLSPSVATVRESSRPDSLSSLKTVTLGESGLHDLREVERGTDWEQAQTNGETHEGSVNTKLRSQTLPSLPMGLGGTREHHPGLGLGDQPIRHHHSQLHHHHLKQHHRHNRHQHHHHRHHHRHSGLPEDYDQPRLEITERRFDVVSEDEKRIRALGWEALREVFEDFADRGDVQTCATMALVAAGELNVTDKRMIRLIESYIDILTRLQLFGCVASIRKRSRLEDIQRPSTVQTVIYTGCAKCKKPLFAQPGGHRPKGGFSYCNSCKVLLTICSICRLPVRGLVFSCPICSHGGHEECYKRYYSSRPMIPIPSLNLLPNMLPNSSMSLASSPFDQFTLAPSGTPAFTLSLPPHLAPPQQGDRSITTMANLTYLNSRLGPGNDPEQSPDSSHGLTAPDMVSSISGGSSGSASSDRNTQPGTSSDKGDGSGPEDGAPVLVIPPLQQSFSLSSIASTDSSTSIEVEGKGDSVSFGSPTSKLTFPPIHASPLSNVSAAGEISVAQAVHDDGAHFASFAALGLAGSSGSAGNSGTSNAMSGSAGGGSSIAALLDPLILSTLSEMPMQTPGQGVNSTTRPGVLTPGHLSAPTTPTATVGGSAPETEPETDGGRDGSSTEASKSGGARKRARPLYGHPCAAGCGHYCWVSNMKGGHKGKDAVKEAGMDTRDAVEKGVDTSDTSSAPVVSDMGANTGTGVEVLLKTGLGIGTVGVNVTRSGGPGSGTRGHLAGIDSGNVGGGTVGAGGVPGSSAILVDDDSTAAISRSGGAGGGGGGPHGVPAKVALPISRTASMASVTSIFSVASDNALGLEH